MKKERRKSEKFNKEIKKGKSKQGKKGIIEKVRIKLKKSEKQGKNLMKKGKKGRRKKRAQDQGDLCQSPEFCL